MASSIDEILNLLWIHIKQEPHTCSPVDEATVQFFGKMKECHPSRKIPQASPPKAQTSPPKVASPKPKPPLQKAEVPVKEEKKEEPEIEPPVSTPQKFDKLLPRAVSFTPIDTFQTRKTIQAHKSLPAISDGCLYQDPKSHHLSWAVFSFLAAPQETTFLNSVLHAMETKLHRKISHFQCLEATFPENLTLSAQDADALFFFIEPHNESTLKKLLEALTAFSAQPLRQVDPFISIGSIHGKPLHLFFLTPTTTTSQDIKSRLWLALKKLAFSPEEI